MFQISNWVKKWQAIFFIQKLRFHATESSFCFGYKKMICKNKLFDLFNVEIEKQVSEVRKKNKT